MTPEEKLKELGYDIQPLNPPAYAPMAYGKITGNLLYLSGATPPAVDGKAWSGRVGETYHVGTGVERDVEQIADLVLGELGLPASRKTLVPDRPGHDRRYAIDASKAARAVSRSIGTGPGPRDQVR